MRQTTEQQADDERFKLPIPTTGFYSFSQTGVHVKTTSKGLEKTHAGPSPIGSNSVDLSSCLIISSVSQMVLIYLQGCELLDLAETAICDIFMQLSALVCHVILKSVHSML